MVTDKNKFWVKAAAALICIVMLWLFAAVTDYVMVIGLYKKPLFCLSANADENGGTFNGIGYSYTIKGNFGRSPDSTFDPYGVHYAALKVFGIEAKYVYRGINE